MSGLILLLIISQFVACSSHTHIATVAALSLREALARSGLGTVTLPGGFGLRTFTVGILIPQIIPKRVPFAPVFVPLFMPPGVGPEVGLAAYRVGDSPSTVIDPPMPYVALIDTFVPCCQKDAGAGTVIALMLPDAVFLIVFWTLRGARQAHRYGANAAATLAPWSRSTRPSSSRAFSPDRQPDGNAPRRIRSISAPG
jgi:aminobenzoyl-glutamate transport protein